MALEEAVVEDGKEPHVYDGRVADNIDGIGCLADEIAEQQSFEPVLSDR